MIKYDVTPLQLFAFILLMSLEMASKLKFIYCLNSKIKWWLSIQLNVNQPVNSHVKPYLLWSLRDPKEKHEDNKSGWLEKDRNERFCTHIWTMSRENLSSGFPTRVDSNRHVQLQRPASLNVLDLASIGIILS